MQKFNDLSNISFRYLLSFGVVFNSSLLYAEEQGDVDISNDAIEHIEPDTPAQQLNLEELLLEVRVNQQQVQNLVLLKDQNDRLYIAEEDLKFNRIQFSHLKSTYYQQQQYYDLKDLDAEIELDLFQMTLQLKVPPKYFERLALLGGAQKIIQMTPSNFGSYLNYDMVVNYTDQNKETKVDGAFEWVTFSPWGSFNTTFLSRNMNRNDIDTLRLDSYFRFDDPDHRRTLIVGDTVSNGTFWSGGLRFAGLQWGTNYNTQPNFNRLPLMSLSGEVLSPSTLDVYVNNALQSQQKVEAGAFSLNDIATVAGNGVAKVVVKDILGRQQIISENFYGNPELLRQGLNDYQVEIGKVRQEYAREDFSYDQWVATTTWRRGISRYFTVEGHAQILDDAWMAGLGAYHTLPYATRLGWVYANSHNGEKRGQLAQISLRKQAPFLNVGLDYQWMSEGFWKLGQEGAQGKVKRHFKMYSNFNLPNQLNLSLNYAQQRYYKKETASVVSMNLSKMLNKRLSLQMLANHSLEKANTMLGIGLNLSLGNSKSASVNSNFNENKATHNLQIQRSAPIGSGIGYRLQNVMTDTARQYQAAFNYQNNYLNTELELAQFENNLSMRSTFEGAMTLLDGQVMPSRKIEDSFGLIRVANLKNVRFFAENQEIGHTNKQGYGIVPRLRSYQTNQLSIEQADLPLNVDIRALSMEIAPYTQSGVLIDFPIKIVRDAFFILIDEQQKPLPLGTALIDENGEETIVGARGEVYLFDVPQTMKLKVQTEENECAVIVDPQQFEQSDQIPTLLCESILQFETSAGAIH